MSQDDTAQKLLFGGDVMLGRGVNKVIHEKGTDYPLEPLYPITRGADLFFINLECAISDTGQRFRGAPKAFYFRADPLALDTLNAAGADLANLANNHALDADIAGLEDTLHLLEEGGIAAVGAGLDLSGARAATTVQSDGLKVGVLGACDHQADFAASEDRPGIHYLDMRSGRSGSLVRAVESLASEVDLVVVALHWQPNWAPEVPPEYRALAGDLVAAGAGILWGHSPHHFQGVEWIDGAVALYATGDLVDDYAIDEHFRNDLQLLFEVGLDGSRIQEVRALPLRLRYARTDLAEGEDRRWIEARFEEMCADVGSRVAREDDWLTVHRA